MRAKSGARTKKSERVRGEADKEFRRSPGGKETAHSLENILAFKTSKIIKRLICRIFAVKK